MVGNVKDIMFRWEDSPALKHHCGFCERPLSHPGARSSCYGPHSEPCSRFHQAMFMRNKSHTCAMCGTADEAHAKRHNVIADKLRAIYDACGEEDWPIVPSDEPERGRIRTRTREDNTLDDDDGHAEGSMRKKDRKEQKRLDRAASRPRLVTLEDRIHIGLVLHTTDRADHTEGPNNIDEVEEIEKNLRYQAQIYNEGAKRCELKEFGKIADARTHVDFDSEMVRILDTLRVIELQKRNTGGRGLQGKRLKLFTTLVVEFKELVVDDLLLLKKDELEIRMRRAAYLRYTSRASYEIVRSRYQDRDWRTGEKYPTKTPDTSQASSRSPALNDDISDDGDEGSVAPSMSSTMDSPAMADKRHLNQKHIQKIGGDSIPNSPATPSVASEIGIKPNSPSPLCRDSTEPNPSLPIPILSIKIPNRQPSSSTSVTEWQHGSGKKESKTPVAPGVTTISAPANTNVLLPKQAAPVTHTQPLTTKVSTLSVPLASGTSKPFEALDEQGKPRPTPNLSPAHRLEPRKHEKHVPVPTASKSKPPRIAENRESGELKKKMKKKKREADRKARRAQERAICSSSTGTEDEPHTPELDATHLASPVLANSDTEIISVTSYDSTNKPAREVQIGDISSSPAPAVAPFESKKYHFKLPLKPFVSMEATKVGSKVQIQPAPSLIPLAKPINLATPPQVQITNTGRFEDWKRYKDHLCVDRYSDQVDLSSDLCIFETTKTVDCNLHDHSAYCICCDPNKKVCWIVYPGTDKCMIGPFNRPRAQKLLDFFNTRDIVKDRVVIIDDCVVHWAAASCVADLPSESIYSFPGLLQEELGEFSRNRPKGRLMTQIDEYRDLWDWNRQIKDPPIDILDRLQQLHEPADNLAICYCKDSILDEEELDFFSKDLIPCSHQDCRRTYFHPRCLGETEMSRLSKLSKWYCFECHFFMEDDAARAIVEVDFMSKGIPLPNWNIAKEIISAGGKPAEPVIQKIFHNMSRQQKEDWLGTLLDGM